jgi:hypothetical protein
MAAVTERLPIGSAKFNAVIASVSEAIHRSQVDGFAPLAMAIPKFRQLLAGRAIDFTSS